MSLVNQMLQELDRRHAVEPPIQATPGAVLGKGVRPTRQPVVGSEWFWRVLAFLILVALGWLGWVVWQLAPRSNVNEAALRSVPRPRVAVTPQPPPAPESAAVSQPRAAAAGAPSSLPETLALATEINTPIKQRTARTTLSTSDKQVLAAAKPATVEELPAAHAEPRPKPFPKPQPPAAQNPRAGAAAPGQIDKRDTDTPRERAEAEFRRALSFVNQGRMAEAMEAFKSALALDGTHETARQTQVSLLLDARRVDEAATSLEQGLALNPTNATFAMLLARIMVQRNDVRGALSLLQKHAFSAENNADYHAFAAALYQRVGLHKEASDEYQKALSVAPQNGAWWVGLGISLESQQRSKDAGEAFRRAKSGPLAPELASYVDQRLKSLQ